MRNNDTRDLIIKRRGYRKNIQGDKFSLYISSYPVAIKYLKARIGDKNKRLAELCCGVGVTLGYLGTAFNHITGVDIDKNILAGCEFNLKAVGLLEKTTLILGDINNDDVLRRIKADLVIYDIPFWSPYKYINKGNLTKNNPLLKFTIQRIKRFITNDIIVFCSPKSNYSIIRNELGPCEFQKIYINGKHDRNYIYLGGLRQKYGVTEINLSTNINN